MASLRQLAHAWRLAALALVLIALAARLLVPAGFMPVHDARGARLVLCSGEGPMRMAMPMPGHGPRHSQHDSGGDDHSPCGFGALGAPALGGADAILLAAAIAFIVAHGRIGAPAPPIALPARLRPPLRAPPA